MTGDHRREYHGDFSVGPIGGDAIGVGQDVHVVIGAGSPEQAELQRRLGELERLLEQHAAELEDGQTARDAVADAQQEARSATPQPRRLTRFLKEITDSASGVSAVTAAVQGIRTLLVGLA